MSKKKKQRAVLGDSAAVKATQEEVLVNEQKPQVPEIESDKTEELEEVLEEEVAEKRDQDEEATQETPVPVIKEPEEELVVAESPVAEEEVKVAEPVKPTPAVVTPVAKPVATKASDVLPKPGGLIRRRMNTNGRHTPEGVRLIKMLEDWRTEMTSGREDRAALMNRMNMLKNIVNTACPSTPKPDNVGADLVRIVFDEFMANYGKAYDDSTIFRLDYKLGEPAQIDKINMFISAITQLVDAASGRTENIVFDSGRLGLVLKNRSVVAAIVRLREGIERRISQQKSI